jgi:transposase
MTHIAGIERDQLLLLPEAVDDYVEADNSVRFIDAFVDGLDLATAGFRRVEAKATGRPGYAPCDLLKLYIYGYLNRVRSSRRLEREAHRNIEVIWLLRSLRPDFKTIADFRRDNRAAFRAVFRQFVLLCRRLDLYPYRMIDLKAGQYVVDAVPTQTIEGFWSILKRGVVGTYRKVSKKYLHLYLAEFQFRYNNRENADVFGAAIKGC